MEITAADAYKITEETYKPVDAWDKLFEKIREKSEKGFTSYALMKKPRA